MILPRSHHVSELVIKHFHETTMHAGTENVLSHLRAGTGYQRLDQASRKCNETASLVNDAIVNQKHNGWLTYQVIGQRQKIHQSHL